MKKKLEPFSIAGVLDYCPECGATGDYALLKTAALKAIKFWEECGRFPDTSRDLERLQSAFAELQNVIDKKKR